MDDIRDPAGLPHPPDAPELPRRVHLYPAQWIGIPVLFLIPILAALGLFGETRQRSVALTDQIRLEVEYPDRLRRGKRSDVQVRVENLSGGALDAGEVHFDPAYFNRFENISFLPQPRFPERVELPLLGPGEAATVRVELEGGHPWRQEGDISVAYDGADVARVRIGTFVFP